MKNLTREESAKVKAARRVLFKAHMRALFAGDSDFSRKCAWHYSEGLKALSDNNALTFKQALDAASEHCDKATALSHEDQDTRVNLALADWQALRAEARATRRPAILDTLDARERQGG